MVVELDEFEERFLPALPTLHPKTPSQATGIVSHLQTTLSRTSESRLNIKERIGTILVSPYLSDMGVIGLRAHFLSFQLFKTTTSPKATMPEDITTRAKRRTPMTPRPSRCSIPRNTPPASVRSKKTGVACR